MKHKITLIKGDGTGPELVEQAKQVLSTLTEKYNFEISWDECEAGNTIFEKTGNALPQKTIDSIKNNKVILKAPITTPVGKGFRSINVQLRYMFDLYQNIRPAKTYKGVRSKYSNINIITFRENTDDIYIGVEFEKDKPETKELISTIKKLNPAGKKIQPDSGISIKPISVEKTKRIVKAAFEYASKNNRGKVTAVHKANIMKFTDGLFLTSAQEVAKEYPNIEFEDRIVDNMCMQLVQKPELYDVLVCPNLYGDIVSDLTSGLVGGLGITAGANIGDGYAMFEAVHGSAPKYADQNKVNPTAFLFAVKMMLDYLNEKNAAIALESAIAEVIAEGKNVTYDLKEDRNDPTTVGTKEMTDAIIERIKIHKK
ncbi:isocitrate dehydrogenase [Candidatus Woesearchaeota archaeon CG10_big_fil_rev_8_21_14_0_10_34_8]|nr:MAG: isocitrate dehydrogenase [Candidatus Woesearchaeota archaeon CG10_big_fil_rev_8_21_14_0_10_34_8]